MSPRKPVFRGRRAARSAAAQRDPERHEQPASIHIERPADRAELLGAATGNRLARAIIGDLFPGFVRPAQIRQLRTTAAHSRGNRLLRLICPTADRHDPITRGAGSAWTDSLSSPRADPLDERSAKAKPEVERSQQAPCGIAPRVRRPAVDRVHLLPGKNCDVIGPGERRERAGQGRRMPEEAMLAPQRGCIGRFQVAGEEMMEEDPAGPFHVVHRRARSERTREIGNGAEVARIDVPEVTAGRVQADPVSTEVVKVREKAEEGVVAGRVGMLTQAMNQRMGDEHRAFGHTDGVRLAANRLRQSGSDQPLPIEGSQDARHANSGDEAMHLESSQSRVKERRLLVIASREGLRRPAV